ncbi:MAG: hypothetical protein K0R65_121 [Crocinitomicaceae bacterium]|jgi:uncharacterized protein YdeI (YjbR/CyaY-like superfamily)|nr:hypothetical protein [Crocinitomicaceae bacterium]
MSKEKEKQKEKEHEPGTFYPSSKQEWRKWLEKNHDKEQSVWLICYKMKSGVPTISWSDAVDEALCFGWIDSTRKTRDEDSFIQFFTRRKAKSNWSKINKDKVKRLIEEKKMMPAGYASIETAKENGSWNILDEVEELSIPDDLEKAFKNHPGSKDFFLSLSKSVRKMMLYWIVSAKRPETKEKRISEIVEAAGKKQKLKRFG